MFFVFFNDTATTVIYTYLHTLSQHDALPFSANTIRSGRVCREALQSAFVSGPAIFPFHDLFRRAWQRDGCRTHSCLAAIAQGPCPRGRSEEHTSELQSLMRISYAVFCLKKQNQNKNTFYFRLYQ